MLPAVASGIVTGDAPVSYWPIFSLSLVTLPEVFAKKDAYISRLLQDEAFSWRLGKLLCGLKKFPFFEILLSKHFLS